MEGALSSASDAAKLVNVSRIAVWSHSCTEEDVIKEELKLTSICLLNVQPSESGHATTMPRNSPHLIPSKWELRALTSHARLSLTGQVHWEQLRASKIHCLLLFP